MHWLATWTWDSDADAPEDAAREALATQRNPDSIATVFTVTDQHNTYEVDLTEGTTRLVREHISENAARLALEIAYQTTGLDNEDKQAEGEALRHYARAKKHRDADRARINGMTIALTYVLGRPMDMAVARAFIAEVKEEKGN
jgi:hypothetical protein